MVIYIKGDKKTELFHTNIITVKDVCEIIAPHEVKKKIEKEKLLIIENDKKQIYLVSALDIVKSINKLYPESTVINLGEIDIFVDYKPEKQKINRPLQILKIILVCTIIFTGSAIAIMSFYNDAQLGKILMTFHKMIFNETSDNPVIINISYSIGLFFGIIMFFNHFGGIKFTKDPTPIEVEMSLYENDVTDVLIDHLNHDQKKEKNNASND